MTKMRMPAIIIIALLTIYFELNAQAPCEIDYTLTTDVNAPSNKKFSHRPNFFQWIGQEVFDVNSPNFPTGTVQSPFFQHATITDDLYEFRDYLVEDGWELIIERFGFDYDADGNRTESTVEVPNPYFILYNKYRSILRVLVLIGEDDGGYSFVKLKFLSTPTLDGIQTNSIHQANYQKPLIPIEAFNYNSVHDLVAVSRYGNTTGDWFWADFPVMYDPCACLYKSELSIEVSLIAEAQVSLTTTGTLIEIQAGQQGNIADNANHISISSLLEAGSKAYSTYESINSFTSKELAAVDNAISEGKVSAERGAEATNSLSLLQKTIKKSSFLQDGFKAAPYIGAAITLIDFLFGGGQTASVTPPIMFREEVTTTGSITTQNDIESIFFGNPGGTLTGFDIADQPYYNNPLGGFAVVKTPTYDYWTDESGYIFVNSENCLLGDSWDHYYFRLNTPIDFAVNPGSGFEWEDAGDVEIVASLVAEFDDVQGYPFVSKEVEDLGNTDFIIEEQKRRVSTRYVPLSCASDMTLECWVKRDNTHNRPTCNYQNIWFPLPVQPAVLQPRVYVKLLVNLKRKDGGPNVLFVGMYPLSPGDEVTGSGNWTLGEWNTAVAHIDLKEEITTNSEYAAWETVDIKPDFVLSNNASLLVTAGETITVSGEVTIPNEATLRISTPVFCEGTLNSMDVQDLEDFCTSNLDGNYKPESRSMSKSGPALFGSVMPVAGVTGIIVSKAFPNPASNSVSLYVEAKEPTIINIKIFNEIGMMVGSESSYELTTGINKIRVDGLYGVGFHSIIIEAGGQTVMRRFVVMK
ncbi:MAG: hypothetical protein HYX66_03765 [Ignavibacteria bacterium]|nr:hypothetical protein [Ignavibacteria bacterium]